MPGVIQVTQKQDTFIFRVEGTGAIKVGVAVRVDGGSEVGVRGGAMVAGRCCGG